MVAFGKDECQPHHRYLAQTGAAPIAVVRQTRVQYISNTQLLLASQQQGNIIDSFRSNYSFGIHADTRTDFLFFAQLLHDRELGYIYPNHPPFRRTYV
jgi:hypothetical protein